MISLETSHMDAKKCRYSTHGYRAASQRLELAFQSQMQWAQGQSNPEYITLIEPHQAKLWGVKVAGWARAGLGCPSTAQKTLGDNLILSSFIKIRNAKLI